MSDIQMLDMRVVDSAFAIESGYVLDFSDRTMSILFEEELNLDIDAADYRDDWPATSFILLASLGIVGHVWRNNFRSEFQF